MPLAPCGARGGIITWIARSAHTTQPPTIIWPARQSCRPAIYFACVNFVFYLPLFNDFSETNYLTIRMKVFWVQMIDPDLFFRYFKGGCHGNQFCAKMANSALSLLWHSEKECDNTVYMHDLIAPLYRVKFW